MTFLVNFRLTTGCAAFVYSRAGYGNSDPADLPRAVDFMHGEALSTLPKVLDAADIQNAILIGHSDGGSIALIYAGAVKDPRVRGLILEAPHVFVEDLGIESIRAIADRIEKVICARDWRGITSETSMRCFGVGMIFGSSMSLEAGTSRNTLQQSRSRCC